MVVHGQNQWPNLLLRDPKSGLLILDLITVKRCKQCHHIPAGHSWSRSQIEADFGAAPSQEEASWKEKRREG
uniref:Uncharacterized protein n=1 Tax=Cannabis sativa TaxID=3483 RepID=A0A803RB16_CANSA